LKDRIDLLKVQFDRWGGGFVIEISNSAVDGITMPGARIFRRTE
jgi:hypothetical protein